MLTASDFIDLDFGDSKRSAEVEKARICRQILALPRLPKNERNGLAQELLEIAVNRIEPIERRVQAASMLGFQAHRLGIQGSTIIAHSLVEALEDEFVGIDEDQAQAKEKLQNLNGINLVLLRNILYAILRIHPITGKETVRIVANLMNGTYTGVWLKDLLQKY